MKAPVSFCIVQGPEDKCLYINDTRVAGPKPWENGCVIAEFDADIDECLKAIGDPQ